MLKSSVPIVILLPLSSHSTSPTECPIEMKPPDNRIQLTFQRFIREINISIFRNWTDQFIDVCYKITLSDKTKRGKTT